MKSVEIETNWARWCPCHNGTTPYGDLNGYVCQKCGKTVCVNCIYKTAKGYLCIDCIRKAKIKKATPLIGKSDTMKKNKNAFAAILAFAVIGYLLILVFEILAVPAELMWLFTTIFAVCLITLLGYIAIVILSNTKRTNIKINEKELELLDKKAKNKKD